MPETAGGSCPKSSASRKTTFSAAMVVQTLYTDWYTPPAKRALVTAPAFAEYEEALNQAGTGDRFLSWRGKLWKSQKLMWIAYPRSMIWYSSAIRTIPRVS